MIRDHGKYFGFDFETEDANLIHARPWQVGYVIEDFGKLTFKEHYIDWPDLNISEKAKQITGFDQSVYDSKKEDPLKVFKIVSRYLKDKKYVKFGHNIIGFDVMIYNVMARAIGEKEDYSFLDQCVDTLCIEKAIEFGIGLNSSNLLSQQIGLATRIVKKGKMQLGHLAVKYDIEHDENDFHDALKDIKINHGIFKKQIWKAKI